MKSPFRYTRRLTQAMATDMNTLTSNNAHILFIVLTRYATILRFRNANRRKYAKPNHYVTMDETRGGW